MPAQPAQPTSSTPPLPSPAAAQPGVGEGSVVDPQELALLQAIQRDGPANTAAWTTLLKRYQDRLYAVCLRMTGNPDVAADLTQDSMLKIIQGLPGYDARSKLSTWMIRVAMNTCFSYLRGHKLRKHASLDSILDSGTATEQLPKRRSTADRGVASQGPTVARTKAGAEDKKQAARGGTPPDKAETGFSPRLFTGPGGAGGGGSADWREQYREQTPEQSVEQDERRHMVAIALGSLAPDQRAILVLRDVQGFDYDEIADAMGLAVGTVKSRLFRARVALRQAIEQAEGIVE